MYKILNINGEDYKLEFSIEASLYNECIESITHLMMSLDSTENTDALLRGMSNLPQTALICFYAGLMEHHGFDGDGRVTSLKTAKKLATSMIRDEGNEINDWFGILNLCADQMGEDGFFGLIGLSGMTESPKLKGKPKKTPQDHKKKEVSEK